MKEDKQILQHSQLCR